MNTVGKTLAGVLGATLFAAVPAFASSEVESDLAELRELMQGLQDKVQAQEEQLEHQSKLLQDAQEVVREQQRETESLSAISEFWQAIDVNMVAAGSYAYNFQQPYNGTSTGPGGTTPGPYFPGTGANTGRSGLFYPFHPDYNSFQVDQVLIGIGKEATEESRGGFQFTLLYGTTATFLGQGSPVGSYFGFGTGTTPPVAFNDSTSDYYVHQAYVSYLAPIGEGVEFDFGKFATLVGAEVADTSQNFNITNGNIYNLFQPIDHVGLLASTDVGPVSLAAGIVNESSLALSAPDINHEKSYIGSIGFNADPVSFGATVIYGADGVLVSPSGGAFPHTEEQDRGILDLLATLDTDAFEAWINADYLWVEETAAAAWGVALAGRVPLGDVVSAALRLEYARDKANLFGLLLATRNSEVYGATGTLAFQLAENLTLRGELRWDRVVEENGAAPDEFFNLNTKSENDQVVALGQVVYAF